MAPVLRPDLLAYLPQHEWEVAGVTVLIGSLLNAAPALWSGRTSTLPHWPPRRVRLLAVAGVLVGGAVAIVSFVVNAEPPGGVRQGHWGTRVDHGFLAVWLLFATAIITRNLLREFRYLRRRHRGDSDNEQRWRKPAKPSR